jgi:glycosyltransferase involved in cell wall biosynthesis
MTKMISYIDNGQTIINKTNQEEDIPCVSVCVPTYNRRTLLEQTLESLRCQTYKDYEIIVCNDCSTDGTREFLDSLDWVNLRVLHNNENLNLPGTMTRLFAAARGMFIGMQHDHDLYAPDFIEKMVAVLNRYPTAGFACCAYHLSFGRDQLVNNPFISEYKLFPPSNLLKGQELIKVLAKSQHTTIPAMGTMFRRECVEKAGGYRPDWYLAADEDLYRRVATVSDVAFCREALFTMQVRPVERYEILGSWKSIYTLHEFRADTTMNYLPSSHLIKYYNMTRLYVLRLYALWRESISLWLHGEKNQLYKALNTGEIPPLPSGRQHLSFYQRKLLAGWLFILGKSIKCGKYIGKLRSKIRSSEILNGPSSGGE